MIINEQDYPGLQMGSGGLFYDLDWFYNELQQDPKYIPERYKIVYINSKTCMVRLKKHYRICA